MRLGRPLHLWLLIAALPLAACDGVSRSRPNVLVIVVDTLRADRLGVYGNQAQLTPFLDSLAQSASVFHSAYAQAPWTSASIASLFTSRFQSQHGVLSFWDELPADETTLAELLSAKGFTTGAFNANFLVGSNLGYAQGFDNYQTYSRSTEEDGRTKYFKVRGEHLNEESLRWLDGLPRGPGNAAPPVFLYLQYMEPHTPYDPAPEFVDRVLRGRPPSDRATANARMASATLGEFSDDLVRSITDYYDAEVAAVDEVLRELFAALRTRGFLDDAIVVITADHGEELHEHGHMGHDRALFEESIHVPLLILPPGQSKHVDISAVVSLTDIAPTILDLLGIAEPPAFEGKSLLDLMGLTHPTWWQRIFDPGATPGAESQGGEYAFSELLKEERGAHQTHERAIIGAAGKMIVDADGRREFYDLRVDPRETDPDSLAAERRAPLTDGLTDFVATAKRAASPPDALTPDADTRERMRALGYAE